MKFLIASDIHGSFEAVERILELKKIEKADKVVLLGDIYYHGPRNPFPKEYSPMDVAGLLNSIKDDLIVIEGNCDSQVDTLVSSFDFVKEVVLVSGGKSVFCSHGHIYNRDNPPKTKYNAVLYGHFHTGFIERDGETVFANPGSTSLPKCNTPKSYMILEDDRLTLKDLDGKVISEVTI